MNKFLHQILEIALSVAPWLLLGLLAAGLVKALVPEPALRRWLGGRGIGAVSRAAVIGAPLPLCSCGVIPTALALHRGGAGRGPTTAFLIGGPGVGVDSLAITYALLGPFMALMRPLGAAVTAITTGLLVGAVPEKKITRARQASAFGDCGCTGCGTARPMVMARASLPFRLRKGLTYSFIEMLDDIIVWLLLGLVIAGVVMTLVPPGALAEYGSGLALMLLMAVVGIPMYICATAATPIGAAMLVAGISPGTVLVFLLAGPITSFATLLVLRRELGTPALAMYLLGIVLTTVSVGLLADRLVVLLGLPLSFQLGTARELFPQWVEILALFILVVFAFRPLRRLMIG